jgi:hypothetical protein
MKGKTVPGRTGKTQRTATSLDGALAVVDVRFFFILQYVSELEVVKSVQRKQFLKDGDKIISTFHRF